MKNGIRMAGLTAAILAGAATQGIAEDMGKGMGPQGMRPSFEELDADGDGTIAKAELQAHMQARFAAADTDGDGKLSRDEMDARMQARQAERRKRHLDWMMERRDTDGDGALGLDELRGDRAGRMFAHADADEDGAVSQAEFDEMRRRHHRRGEHGHGKHHHGEHRHGKHGHGHWDDNG